MTGATVRTLWRHGMAHMVFCERLAGKRKFIDKNCARPQKAHAPPDRRGEFTKGSHMISSNRFSILGIVLCILILLLNIGCSDDWGKHVVGDWRYNHHKVSIALKQIRKAQATYKDKQGNYGSIDDLIAAKLIDTKMASKEFYGYNVKIRHEPNSYEVIATPIKYGGTGLRYYYLDESGIIRVSWEEGKEAGPSDQPIVEK